MNLGGYYGKSRFYSGRIAFSGNDITGLMLSNNAHIDARGGLFGPTGDKDGGVIVVEKPNPLWINASFFKAVVMLPEYDNAVGSVSVGKPLNVLQTGAQRIKVLSRPAACQQSGCKRAIRFGWIRKEWTL